MTIVLQQTSSKNIAETSVGKQIHPRLVVRLFSAREGMKRWGLAQFGTNQILGAALTTTGFYYSARYMQVKQI